MSRQVVTSCPVCGGCHFQRLWTSEDHFATHETFGIEECTACGFRFTQEAPDEEEMGRYYDVPDYVSHTDTRRGVVNLLYHAVRSVMLRRKGRLVQRAALDKRGRLLDIGSGTGYFAHAMKQRRWVGETVEQRESARLCAWDNFGLRSREAEELYELPPRSFNAITLWHVMEHVAPIDRLWRKLDELLSEDGILVVAVPNCASYDAQHYGSGWAAYDVPRHLWHFTPTTMQRIAQQYGFVMEQRHNMPFDGFYITILSERFRRSCLSLVIGTFRGAITLARCLAKKDESSSMIYIFRKKRQ